MNATRREFIRLSVLSGSALAIGFRAGDSAAAEPQPFQPNGWIRIDPDGFVTLTVGKSEMGQGVRTSLPMILAEELGADWTRIRLVQASPGPDFQRLGTGGSFSVSGSWKPLRTAGAAAREMLLSAAALTWGVDRAECRAANGSVVHLPTKRSMHFGELTAKAATLPLPVDPPLKPLSEASLLGRPTKRFDGPAIVTGKAKFGLDTKIPKMRYATLVRPPVLGGKVASFDATAAKKVRGVRDVVRISNGVAVVADNSWAALKGRDALIVAFEPGPFAAFDSDVHAGRLATAAATPGFTMTKTGDGLAALEQAAQKLTAEYSYPFYPHAPLETMNCVADVRKDECELWIPTQSPNGAQRDVAKLLGLALEKVRVNVTLMGGAFGRRLANDYAIEAAEVSRAIAAPVQLFWTRADDMKHGHFQAASVHHLSGGLDATGRLTTWGHKKASSFHNLGAKPTAEELSTAAYYQDSAWGVYDIPYNIASTETAYAVVDTHVPIGPWRAVFSPPSTFARESFIDELARAAKQDPIEFRLRMLDGTETVKAGGLTIDRQRLRRVLEVVREKSGWTRPLAPGLGRGVACNVYAGQTHVAYVAEASVRDGVPRVHRVVCVIDCGVVVNPLGIESQVEGGVIWGLSSAFKGEITFRKGEVEQSSFADFEVLRIDETPVVEVHIIPSHGAQPYGVGEPTVPPLVPAVINAIFDATGKRVRRLPIRPSDFKESGA